MKRLLSLIFMPVVLACSSCGGRIPKMADSLPAGGYKLIWADEFDYEGLPDTSRWVFETGYVRNSEPQCYTTGNAVCQDGYLTIEARMDDGILTSSSIETRGKADFLYGHIEARMKVPVAQSAWPAFWTVGSTRNWPDCGEIDIMEFYRYQDVPSILGNAFWLSENGEDMIDDTGVVPLSIFLDNDPDWVDKFHIWTLDWDRDKMEIRVDDTLVNTIDITESYNRAGAHKGENPLRQPQYLKLNLALRGRPNDPVDESVLPMRFVIDYVRVFEKK